MSEHQRFIVVFKDHVDQDKIDKYADEVKDNGGEVTAKYAILKVIETRILPHES
ncbi:hypothetical protein H0H93_003497 [Arthromyces matolae]|nr:hypothetical protein H0H93_003497 [Arthromyces matolae]